MRYLDILEVSQKQAYIFASNYLQDNVRRSEEIARITGGDFIEEVVQDKKIFDKARNIVYSGGGHTVLEFPDEETARECNRRVTMEVHRKYPEAELFASLWEYQEEVPEDYIEKHRDTYEELYKDNIPMYNLDRLIEKLEKKKAERKAAFHQGSFGIEKISSETRNPQRYGEKNGEGGKDKGDADKGLRDVFIPDNYEKDGKFEHLGGSKGESNFIAVVHIDGNGMGKRIRDYYRAHHGEDWETFKGNIRTFSDSIDCDFKGAFREMNNVIASNLKAGRLDALKLDKGRFPLRSLIAAGDDICFVSEGRIGVEAARIFLEKLAGKVNEADHKPYYACAGVAIVHLKYPFFKAYELAEALCGNAKSFGAMLDAPSEANGAEISSIDWHIELGEIGDSLEEIRAGYEVHERGAEGEAQTYHLELRPLVVVAGQRDVLFQKEPVRWYGNFRKQILSYMDKKNTFARGKLKTLRTELRKSGDDAEFFLKFYKIWDLALSSYQGIFTMPDYGRLFTGTGQDRTLYFPCRGKGGKDENRCLVFDAIELMDTFLPLETNLDAAGQQAKEAVQEKEARQ